MPRHNQDNISTASPYRRFRIGSPGTILRIMKCSLPSQTGVSCHRYRKFASESPLPVLLNVHTINLYLHVFFCQTNCRAILKMSGNITNSSCRNCSGWIRSLPMKKAVNASWNIYAPIVRKRCYKIIPLTTNTAPLIYPLGRSPCVSSTAARSLAIRSPISASRAIALKPLPPSSPIRKIFGVSS